MIPISVSKTPTLGYTTAEEKEVTDCCQLHDETPAAARCSHPSARPHDRHILSTTRIFSSRPSPGSSKSPTSSRKPSLSRLRGGSHVSAYCRSEDTESSSRPAVRCGIAPFIPSSSS